jgi:diaminopimelate epimerase
VSFAFLKGHGTRNDFIVLPDPDGSVHGELAASVVVALCDRRAGIGADGVLRALRRPPGDPDGESAAEPRAQWFMDYRNADGSVSEMCGNGVRVLARYLQLAGLVDPSEPLFVGTRGGVKTLTFRGDDGDISVDMGPVRLGSRARVGVNGRTYDAQAVDAGNPHAVVLVDSLDGVGGLGEAPDLDRRDFPDGANVEFVETRGPLELAMRVFERGVGETASCGTGACAVAAAVAARDHIARPTAYTVAVPGGRLGVRLDNAGSAHLTGPAVLVAEGIWTG